jgi:arylsulfatase A-like enzyme
VIFALVASLIIVPSFPKGLASSMLSPNSLYPQIAFGQIQEEDRPNVLIIMGDDLGFSDIGIFGSEISTPNLDALAREGKILPNYHTHPTCSPARASLLTGVDNHIAGLGTMAENLAPNQIGKPGYEGYLTDRAPTVAELLRDAGYHTMMSGKWHLSGTGIQNGTTPSDKGFEESFSLIEGGANHFTYEPVYPGGHATFMHNQDIVERPTNMTYSNDLYTNNMINSIKNYQEDGKPLFMYLSFQVGHTPFQAPQEHIKKYEQIYDSGWNEIRQQRFEKQKELGIWPANMTFPRGVPPLPSWESLNQTEKQHYSKVFAVHAAMIENMDENIGRVIQYLRDIGEYDNTLIMFASDNGLSDPAESPLDIPLEEQEGIPPQEIEEFSASTNNTVPNIGNASSNVGYGWRGSVMSASPLSGLKATQFEGGTRAPFIMKEPSPADTALVQGTDALSEKVDIIRANVRVTDMTPTFLEYAGVQHPGETYQGKSIHPPTGKSIKPLLEGAVQQVHSDDEVLSQELFGNIAAYMGEWKALKQTFPNGTGEWRLFNLAQDVSEDIRSDLSQQYPDVLNKMVSSYESFAKEVGIIPPQFDLESQESYEEPFGNETQIFAPITD